MTATPDLHFRLIRFSPIFSSIRWQQYSVSRATDRNLRQRKGSIGAGRDSVAQLRLADFAACRHRQRLYEDDIVRQPARTKRVCSAHGLRNRNNDRCCRQCSAKLHGFHHARRRHSGVCPSSATARPSSARARRGSRRRFHSRFSGCSAAERLANANDTYKQPSRFPAETPRDGEDQSQALASPVVLAVGCDRFSQTFPHQHQGRSESSCNERGRR